MAKKTGQQQRHQQQRPQQATIGSAGPAEIDVWTRPTVHHSGCPAACEVVPRSGSQQGSWRPWGIGGSDIGAILGLSNYRTPVDVWLDKTGAGSNDPRPVRVAQRLGHYLEPFVVQEYEQLTGNVCVAHPEPFRHPVHPELFGHVDRIATHGVGLHAKQVVLECKTSSAFRASEWGPSWSDLVPAEYLVQCLWYLGLSGLEEAHLAVLLGNTELRTYRVVRDEGLIGHMFDRAHRFWVEHVLASVPPEPTTREGVESLHPEHTPGLSKEANECVLKDLARYAELDQALCATRSELDALRDRVAVAMGPAEELTCAGQTVATWRRSRDATRLDTERLRRERPDVFRSYCVVRPGSRRLLISATSQQGLQATNEEST